MWFYPSNEEDSHNFFVGYLWNITKKLWVGRLWKNSEAKKPCHFLNEVFLTVECVA